MIQIKGYSIVTLKGRLETMDGEQGLPHILAGRGSKNVTLQRLPGQL